MMNTLLSFGIHHIWKRIAVRMLELNSEDRVLDVCGGTGDLAILAAGAVSPAGRVTLYDFSSAMINAYSIYSGGYSANFVSRRKF